MNLTIKASRGKIAKGSTRIGYADLMFDNSIMVEGFVLWTGDDKKIHLVSPKYMADTFDLDGNFEKKPLVVFSDLNLKTKIRDECFTLIENMAENDTVSEKTISFPAGSFHVKSEQKINGEGRPVIHNSIIIGNSLSINGFIGTKDKSGTKKIKTPKCRIKGEIKELVAFFKPDEAKEIWKKMKA